MEIPELAIKIKSKKHLAITSGVVLLIFFAYQDIWLLLMFLAGTMCGLYALEKKEELISD